MEKSIFAGAKSYSVKITKPSVYDGYDDGDLNIVVTDELTSVEGNFYGGGSGVQAKIKFTSAIPAERGGNAVYNCIEIINNDGDNFFKVEEIPDEEYGINSGLKLSFFGAWEYEAITRGLRIVMETMDEVIREVAKWK